MEVITLRPGNLIYSLTPSSPRVPTGEVLRIISITNDGIIMCESYMSSSVIKNKLAVKDLAAIPLNDKWRRVLGLIYKVRTDEWIWNNNHIDWSLTKFEM